MSGERWAEVLDVDAALPAEIGAAVRLVQRRAHGERLPVVQVGSLLVIPLADFNEFYGDLPTSDGAA